MNGRLGGALVTLAGLLLAALVAATGPARPRRARWAEVLLIAGTAPWLFLLLRSGHQRLGSRYLVPFTDLRDQFRVGLGFAAVQITGNLLVFAAFGFGAPIRWRIGAGTVLAVTATASIGVEITQYLMADGRVASVDDVIVNAAGATVAALCSRRWWRTRRPWPDRPEKPASTLSSDAGSVGQR